jgi:hypothetical protein
LIWDSCHNNQLLDVSAKGLIHFGCRVQTYSNNYDGFVTAFSIFVSISFDGANKFL